MIRAVWRSGVSPRGKLGEVLVNCVEEWGVEEDVDEPYRREGVSFDGAGTGVGVLTENVGVRMLAAVYWNASQSQCLVTHQ